MRLNTEEMLADFGFSGATLAERGLWVTMAMQVHVSGAEDGCLRHCGKPVTVGMLATRLRVDVAELEEMLGRLSELALIERAQDGTICLPWVGLDVVEAKRLSQKNSVKGQKSGVSRRRKRDANHGLTASHGESNHGSTTVQPELNQRPTETRRNETRRDETKQQQHAGGDAAGAAAAELLHGEEETDEVHDERLLALAGLGIVGPVAEELAALEWVTARAIDRVKASRRQGEGTGLLIERLRVDEKGKWQASMATEQAAAAAEAERRRTLEQQREALAKAAEDEETSDEHLLAETGEAELMAAMERLPDTRARLHVRTLTPDKRDGRGLPVDRALRHLTAVAVREGRKRKAILGAVRLGFEGVGVGTGGAVGVGAG
jgi:hypothetical protein